MIEFLCSIACTELLSQDIPLIPEIVPPLAMQSSFILTPFLYYPCVYKSLKYPAPDGHHFLLSRYLKVGLYLICQRKTLHIAGANKISLDNQISLLGIRYLKFQDLSPPMIIHAPQLH